MAEIYRGNGKWIARVSFKGTDGKRHYKSKSGFRTKREAEVYGIELEQQVHSGGKISQRNITFLDYFTEWFKIFRKPNIADATAERYQYTINTITKYFGNTLLRKIDTAQYQKFLNRYGLGDGKDEKTHSKESAAKINVHIRAAVRNAVNDGVIPRDFTLNTHIVFDTSNTREIKYLSYKDAAKLYKVTMSNLNGLDVTSYMCLTALLTGMRQQEIAGLTWTDIDVKNGTIDINKSWNWKKRDFGPTKNPYSIRKIKVDRNLLNILQKLHYEQDLFLKSKEISNPKDLVFFSRYQRVPSSKALNDGLAELLKSASIDQKLNFHGLRHTHASILLYQKASIAYISHRLGHESISTTTKTYLHIIQELEQAEDDKAERVMTKLGSGVDWGRFNSDATKSVKM